MSAKEAYASGVQELVCLRTLLAEDLIAELAERSEFVKTQFECQDENSSVGDVKVPTPAGKLWVRCLLRSPAALRATDDGTLVQFVQVRSRVLPVLCYAPVRRQGLLSGEVIGMSVKSSC